MRRYRLDLEESQIIWKGFQPKNEIKGEAYFKGGMICVEKEDVTGAELIIDSSSIISWDEKLNEEKQKTLTNHLKSIDFFDADIYPAITFASNKVRRLNQEETDACRTEGLIDATHEVTGTLSIKNVRMEIRFPARIVFVMNHIKGEALIKLDRTSWGINFMLEDSFGDQKVLPKFEVNVKFTGEGFDEVELKA